MAKTTDQQGWMIYAGMHHMVHSAAEWGSWRQLVMK